MHQHYKKQSIILSENKTQNYMHTMIIAMQNKMIKVHRISCSASRSCLLELLIFESLRNVYIFSLSNSASENTSQENDLKCKKKV